MQLEIKITYLLPEPDSMLSLHPEWLDKFKGLSTSIPAVYAYRDGTLHFQCSIHHDVNTVFNSLALFFMVRPIHDDLVEVAITDVTQDTSKET